MSIRNEISAIYKTFWIRMLNYGKRVQQGVGADS